jgi:hypothetical protein
MDRNRPARGLYQWIVFTPTGPVIEWARTRAQACVKVPGGFYAERAAS